VTTLGWIALGLPLLGCLVLALWPGEPDRRLTRLVAVGSVAGAFACTVAIFAIQLGREGAARGDVDRLWQWIDAGGVTVDLAILIDPLSVLMMLVITGVGALIVLYSTEYMGEDRDYRRFFAEMCFFVFAMLLLVEAANFLFLIVGWALVGLASFLLIGFYYDRPTAVAAAKKAFVINVIGDVGMVLAAFLLLRELGTLEYLGVFARAEEGLGHGTGVSEAVALLLFVGAAAKSAQIPLHSWLPDAMEGPTPVSALIHAATMVTAGVYLVVRTHAIYDLAPVAGDVVAVVGCATLVMAATIAFVQEDIKRVLAWSTVSQIGYMIMAAGLGIYSAAMFHFLTHAFFKALLFLAAGIVIHALAGEQSLDRMGGLRRYLPFATGATLIGCLAIAGVPPFAGFFSKDEIIAGALDAGALGVVCGIAAIVAAGMTAFYMFRLFFRAFIAPEPAGGYHHAPHASGATMNAPVGILAVLAVVGGLLQIPGVWHKLEDWLEPVLADAHEPHVSTTAEVIGTVASLVVVAIGIGAAWFVFAADPARRERLSGRFTAAREFLLEEWRFDRVYGAAVIDTGRDLGDALNRTAEARGVQGAVAGAARGAQEAGRGLGWVQNGLVRGYAVVIVVGAAVMGLIVILAVR
jgi:NADH-quinone oxidoreductase subunit L